MVHEVVLQERVKQQLSANPRTGIGVLVGLLSAEKDCVLLHVPTPLLEGDVGESGNEDLPAEDWWVDDHTHQVWDMLPGGLTVVGLYLVSATLSSSALAKMHSLIPKVCKMSKLLLNTFPQPHSHRVFLHLSTTTQRFSCQRLDISNSVAGYQPATLSVQTQANSLRLLDCTVPLQLDMYMPSTGGDICWTVQERLLQALAPLRSGLVVVGDTCCARDEPLETEKNGQHTHCTLYSMQKPATCGTSTLMEWAVMLQVRGEVAAFAYVSPGATVADGAQRLGDDVMKSAIVRWTRLCEDNGEQLEELRQNLARSRVNPLSFDRGKSETYVWQLPKRVLVEVAGQKICLCAYQFPDESRKQLRERVAEVLSVRPAEVTVKDVEKRVAVMAQGGNTSVLSYKYLHVWMMVGTVLVAIFAALLWTTT